MPQAEVKPVCREDLMGAAEQSSEQVAGKRLNIHTEAGGWEDPGGQHSPKGGGHTSPKSTGQSPQTGVLQVL